MSVTTDRSPLRRLCGVVNAWDAVKKAQALGYTGSDVILSYRQPTGGRGSISAAWQVCRPGWKTNPKGHWQDYGHQTFHIHHVREDKPVVLEKARAWAIERYGDQGWAKLPGMTGSDLFPADLVAFWADQVAAAKRTSKES